MTVLTLTDDKLKLRTSKMEEIYVRYIHGGKYRDTSWEYRFSADKVEEIKKVFPNILIDDTVKECVRKDQAKIICLLHTKKLKDCPLNINLKSKLYKKQKVAIQYLLLDDALMNSSQMGAGKCIMSLGAMIARKIKKCLIICPASVKGTWIREIAKHTNEDAILIEGHQKQRFRLYEEWAKDDEPMFVIINYALLRRDVQKISQEWGVLDGIILDESAKIKNPKAQQTKAVKSIQAKYKIALSGYPADNRIEDIWSQFDFLKPGYLGTFWSFQDKYLIKQFHPYAKTAAGKQIKITTGYKNLDELKRKLDPYNIRFLRSDIKELPPKIYELREVELGEDQRKQYNQMKQDLRLKIEKMNDEEVIINAQNILCQLIRLSQITDGFITDTQLVNPIWLKQNAKFNELDDIVEEAIASGNKIVIWSRYVPVSEKLYERYKEHNPVMITGKVPTNQRDKEIVKFQEDDSCKIFVGQVAAGGMGITLTAGSVEVFLDKGFLSPATIAQAEDRCCRIGQTKTVVIISLIAKKTIDERWEKLMAEKEKMADILFKSPRKVFRQKNDVLDLLK